LPVSDYHSWNLDLLLSSPGGSTKLPAAFSPARVTQKLSEKLLLRVRGPTSALANLRFGGLLSA